VNHVLLLSGEEGLKCFNLWTLSHTKKNDPDHIWKRFEQQIKPKHNFRVARLCLQSYRQQDGESVDDYITRLKLQAQKCDFRDDMGVLEQFIAGIRQGIAKRAVVQSTRLHKRTSLGTR